MSRNRQFFLAGVVFLAFLLQVAVLPQFKLFGVQPNLILVVAVVVAVQDGPLEGAILGFCGGLLLDVATPQVMGVGALTIMFAALVAGVLKDMFMTYSILLPVVLVLIASLVEMSLHQGMLALLGQEDMAPFKLSILLVAALYNVLAVFVIYPLLKRFRFPAQEDSLSLAGRR